MLLIKKFRTVFENQIASIGLSIRTTDNEILVAENHEKHLKLQAYLEDMGGSGRLAIAELTVIKGDVQKALQENPFLITQHTSSQKVIGNFTLYTEKEVPNQKIALLHLQSLDTKIYKCDEYIIITQKGNHDLIRKNPIFIDFLRGKTTIDQLFDTIGSLNIPNGLYLQKPLGFGDPEKIKKWKKIGFYVSVFSFVCLLIIMVLKYLTLYK